MIAREIRKHGETFGDGFVKEWCVFASGDDPD